MEAMIMGATIMGNTIMGKPNETQMYKSCHLLFPATISM